MGVANIAYQPGLQVTLIAGATVGAYRFVKISGGTVVHCTAGDIPVGVTDAEGAASGEAVGVTLLTAGGVMRVTTSEAVAAGNGLTTAAAGKAQVVASGETAHLTALSATGADGDVCQAAHAPAGLTARVAALEGYVDSATITLSSVVATNSLKVNGTTLTFRTSGTDPGDVIIGASDTTAAAALAAKIAAMAGLEATSSGAVVTVTGSTPKDLILVEEPTAVRITVAYTSGDYSIWTVARAGLTLPAAE